MDERTINAKELLEAANSGLIGIPVEIGAYLVLLTVEALAERPKAFTSEEITVIEGGRLRIDAPTDASEEEATRSATAFLRELLLAASGASPGALIAWLERAESGASLSLGEMHDVAEASLVPLNREASERALARFIRKSEERIRANKERGREDDLNDEAIDQELDALLQGGAAEPEEERPLPFQSGRGDAARDPLPLHMPPPAARGPGIVLSALVLLAAAALGLYLSRPELFDGLFK